MHTFRWVHRETQIGLGKNEYKLYIIIQIQKPKNLSVQNVSLKLKKAENLERTISPPQKKKKTGQLYYRDRWYSFIDLLILKPKYNNYWLLSKIRFWVKEISLSSSSSHSSFSQLFGNKLGWVYTYKNIINIHNNIFYIYINSTRQKFHVSLTIKITKPGSNPISG